MKKKLLLIIISLMILFLGCTKPNIKVDNDIRHNRMCLVDYAMTDLLKDIDFEGMENGKFSIVYASLDVGHISNEQILLKNFKDQFSNNVGTLVEDEEKSDFLVYVKIKQKKVTEPVEKNPPNVKTPGMKIASHTTAPQTLRYDISRSKKIFLTEIEISIVDKEKEIPIYMSKVTSVNVCGTESLSFEK